MKTNIEYHRCGDMPQWMSFVKVYENYTIITDFFKTPLWWKKRFQDMNEVTWCVCCDRQLIGKHPKKGGDEDNYRQIVKQWFGDNIKEAA